MNTIRNSGTAVTSDKIWFLDLQTTGTSKIRDEIIEIAWSEAILLSDFCENPCEPEPVIHSELLCLAPEFLMSKSQVKRLESLNGLKIEDLSQGALAENVWKSICALMPEFSENCVIHFAQFESSFFDKLTGQRSFSYPILCTHKLARSLLPDLPSKSLRSVAGRFGHFTPESKRAESHLKATIFAARKLFQLARENGHFSVAQMRSLGLTAPPRKHSLSTITKPRTNSSLIDRKYRLDLPNKPGIYRFIGPNDITLYIGKATDLKTRVNSYFRGKKSKGSRLHEMISQIHSLGYLTTESPLHAALIEAENIQLIDPPYNRALRHQKKEVGYLLITNSLQQTRVLSSKDFTNFQSLVGHGHKFYVAGPYSCPEELGNSLSFIKLALLGIAPEKKNSESHFLQTFKEEVVMTAGQILAQEISQRQTVPQQNRLLKSRTLIHCARAELLTQLRESRLFMNQSPREESHEDLAFSEDETHDEQACLRALKGTLRRFLAGAIRGKRLNALAQSSITLKVQKTNSETEPVRIEMEAGALKKDTQKLFTSDPVFQNWMNQTKSLKSLQSKEIQIKKVTAQFCQKNFRIFHRQSYLTTSVLMGEFLRLRVFEREFHLLPKPSQHPDGQNSFDTRTWSARSFFRPLWMK